MNSTQSISVYSETLEVVEAGQQVVQICVRGLLARGGRMVVTRVVLALTCRELGILLALLAVDLRLVQRGRHVAAAERVGGGRHVVHGAAQTTGSAQQFLLAARSSLLLRGQVGNVVLHRRHQVVQPLLENAREKDPPAPGKSTCLGVVAVLVGKRVLAGSQQLLGLVLEAARRVGKRLAAFHVLDTVGQVLGSAADAGAVAAVDGVDQVVQSLVERLGLNAVVLERRIADDVLDHIA